MGRPAHYLDEKNVELFARHSIYTRAEMEARYETALEEYAKTIRIEALTMSQMAHRDVFPAVSKVLSHLADGISAQRIACKTCPAPGRPSC